MEDAKLHIITKVLLDSTTKINFLSNFSPMCLKTLNMEDSLPAFHPHPPPPVSHQYSTKT